MNNIHANLCTAGLSLVPIPRINDEPTKRPTAKGWNKPRSPENPNGYSNNAADFIGCDGFNFGLYHGASNTLALDLDDMTLACKVFEELTDNALLDWLESPGRLEIKSPKANRGKLLFKLPEGFEAANLRQLKHDGAVIFELRCGNCQDVILGQHPEGGDYQLIGNPAAIPNAPAVLLDMLHHWEAWKPCFDSALGGGTEPPTNAPRKPQQGANLAGWQCPIHAFNQSYSVAEVLARTGYKQVSPDRFIRPGSSSKAPGAVVMRNCADGIERVYSHGGDVLNDGYAHDPFDCMKLLEYGGDQSLALNWNEEISKHNQRIFKQEQASGAKDPSQAVSDSQKPFSFTQFSLYGQSKAMRKKMLDDVFVLEGLAILGQATVFYAQFNTGKTLLTLWLLIEAINARRIKGGDVFYINADDTFNGLVTKNELAEQYGFHMLAPNLNGFEPDKFADYLKEVIDNDTAHGKVIVLDTLKKFTDLMDKKTGTAFMKRAREFVQAGGTLIMLAHTNKNKGADGKVIYGGTNDIASDADCVFTIDAVSGDGSMKQVLFENIKSRGNVAREKTFSYSRMDAENYHALVESVVMGDDNAAEAAKIAKAANAKREAFSQAVEAITKALQQGTTLKTELIESAYDFSGISKKKIKDALAAFTGELWSESIGARNATSYALKVKN